MPPLEARASRDQIEFAKSMLLELGYDLEDYDLANMTIQQISKLIKELREELGS